MKISRSPAPAQQSARGLPAAPAEKQAPSNQALQEDLLQSGGIGHVEEGADSLKEPLGFEVDTGQGNLAFKKPEWGTKVATLAHGEEDVENHYDPDQKKEFASTSEMGIPSKVTVRHYDPDQKKEIVGSSTDVIGDTGQKKGSDYTEEAQDAQDAEAAGLMKIDHDTKMATIKR